MARDPFLAAHSVGDNCFEIGGEFSPASVRDQMVRAYLVVDRAFQENVIDVGRNLLVVGAGPSGLTAAIRAAELGVRTVVVERRPRHAFLLARCSSRDVEPTLYDWPRDHWTKDLFEWTGASMELRWRANRADVIAIDWQRRLPAILGMYPGLIDIRYDTAPHLPAGAAPLVDGAGMLDVELVDGVGSRTTETVGGLVSCIGFGMERTRVGAYAGFQFWDTDDFQKPNCGLPSPPRILISGGGDGALQDFARVMTLRSTKAIFASVLRALSPTPWLIAGLQSDIHSAEDVAARALSWNAARHDAPVLRRLEAAHEAVILRLRSSSAWPAVEGAIRSMLPKPSPSVHLVHRNATFGPCYALNRFVTLLILGVLEGATIRLRDTEVQDVRGLVHACTSARICHGQAHDVDLASGGRSWTDQYDVVIVRHGIAGPRHLFGGPTPSRPRHMLPFFADV